jgi:hypothetical protein
MQRWQQPQQLGPKQFTCGSCDRQVASVNGYFSVEERNSAIQTHIYICPNCAVPTYFDKAAGKQIPGPTPGGHVEHLPKDIESLYLEARQCVSIGAYTASVLACRKLLMHIGVAQGASEGGTFISYVEYLAKAGYVPPNGKGWVDHIRNRGNEANHEIKLMKQQDAEELISFITMLLRFIYEFPEKVPKVPTTPH